jgi:hypothetical protein
VRITHRSVTRLAVGLALAFVSGCMFVGSAEAASAAAGIRLAAVSFAQQSVDATAGATVELDWSITDGNADATNLTGDVRVEEVSATGQKIGPAYDISYSFQPSGSVTTFATSGTAQSSAYSYAFNVPQYAATATAKWAVVGVTAADDRSDTLNVGKTGLAEFAGSTFTASELADNTGPAYGAVSVTSHGPAYYNDKAGPVGLTYTVEAVDPESGFFKGVLVLEGPRGQTISTDFAVQFDPSGSTTCGPGTVGWGSNDMLCAVPVVIPRGTAAGTWVVSRLKLTDVAGNVSEYRKLSLAPITLTQNAVLKLTDFSISPTSVDNWIDRQNLTISMTPEGARNGIASATVITDGGCSGWATSKPSANPDGSITMTAVMQSGPANKNCTVTGIAATDGDGDLAAYGSAFDGPALNLVATQIPDTTPPVATSASLNRTSITQSALPQVVTATVGVTSMAGIQEILGGVYGPSGDWITANSVNFSPAVAGGAVQVSVYLPAGLAPGVYTFGFTLLDQAGLATHYGYPGGLGSTAPGGPLQVTITS